MHFGKRGSPSLSYFFNGSGHSLMVIAARSFPEHAPNSTFFQCFFFRPGACLIFALYTGFVSFLSLVSCSVAALPLSQFFTPFAPSAPPPRSRFRRGITDYKVPYSFLHAPFFFPVKIHPFLPEPLTPHNILSGSRLCPLLLESPPPTPLSSC